MTLQLEVQKKEASAEAVRSAGQVPGIVYGPKQEPIAVSIEKVLLEKTLEEAGESTIISLQGLDNEVEVLVHDVAFNPARGGVEHIDFYAIERGKELTTHVALEFEGTAPVEKTGATVNKALHEIEVTCRPSDLPSHITVDVSGLDTDEAHIKVSDLIIPEGVQVETDAELIVANVSAAREEEPEEVAEVDMDAVTVEEKGKQEEDTEGEVEKAE